MVYNVYNRVFQRLLLVDTYISAEWSEDYAGIGNFILILSETPKNIETLQVGYFVKRQSQDNLNIYDSAMIITSVIYNDDRTITVIGCSAIELLKRRIIDETLQVSNAENAMRYAVDNFRPFEAVKLGEYKNLNINFDPPFETTYVNIYDHCLKICEETGLGIRMLLDTQQKKLIFDIYNGVERTNAIYNDVWGNLLSAKLTQSDVQYKNVAYVAGQGRDLERVIVHVGDLTTRDFDRFELYVDARDLQQNETEDINAYKNRLIARGLDKLNDNLKIFNVNLTIPATDLNTKFNLGDFIRVNIDRYNVKLAIRIQGYTLTQVKNIQKLTLSLGVPILRR